MALLNFVPVAVFKARPGTSVRTSIVLDGTMEELETYAEVHNLAWVKHNNFINKSGLTDRFLLQYGGYWTDSVGNVFLPE
jgi:hypothetical protein